MEQRAFTFLEAEVVVKPRGLASQALGYARAYALARTPVLLEDGSVAFYQDRLTIETPWVDDNVVAVTDAPGPFEFITVRWTNEDDGRLASVAVTSARLTELRRGPGPGEVETFALTFEAVSRV
jgi:hypothetical protein